MAQSVGQSCLDKNVKFDLQDSSCYLDRVLDVVISFSKTLAKVVIFKEIYYCCFQRGNDNKKCEIESEQDIVLPVVPILYVHSFFCHTSFIIPVTRKDSAVAAKLC